MISRDFEKLINSFTKIPTVGLKTAERYAYSIINMSKEDAEMLAKNIVDVKSKVHLCKVCGNFTTEEVCDICSSRSSETICVLKESKDIANFEKIKGFNCVYHILNGTLSPIKNITPDKLNINSLLKRINDGGVKEIILALGTDVESEATCMYLTKLLKPLDIKITRLAQGISLGAELEYVNTATLQKAFADRKEVS